MAQSDMKHSRGLVDVEVMIERGANLAPLWQAPASLDPRGPSMHGRLRELDWSRGPQVGGNKLGLDRFGNQRRTSPVDQSESDKRTDDDAIDDEQSRGLVSPIGPF